MAWIRTNGASDYTPGTGIDITNREISIDEMSNTDMSEVASPLPTVGTKYPVLFDEGGNEYQVGWYKYANGTKKPVYRKDINWTTNLTKGNWSYIPHGISNIEKILKADVVTKDTSANEFIVFGGIKNNDGNISYITIVGTTYVYLCAGAASNKTYAATTISLQYTKTTDTAQ